MPYRVPRACVQARNVGVASALMFIDGITPSAALAHVATRHWVIDSAQA